MTKTDFYNLLVTGEIENMISEAAHKRTANNSDEVSRILRPIFAQTPDRERFVAVFLNAKNKVIRIKTLFVGTLTASAVYPREVIKDCLRYRAASLIVAHNHPSDDVSPSREDMALTRQLVLACKLMGISMHEHLILGSKGSPYSFADQGHIARMVSEVSL